MIHMRKKFQFHGNNGRLGITMMARFVWELDKMMKRLKILKSTNL